MVNGNRFNRLGNTGLFVWGLTPTGPAPSGTFFVFHTEPTANVATLSDAFSIANSGRFAVVAGGWWGTLTALDQLLGNTTTASLHFIDGKDAIAKLPFQDASGQWAFGALHFSFSGGINAGLSGDGSALQFFPTA